MSDTTLRIRYETGATLYTQIEAPAATVWNGASYESYAVANWSTYATSTPETPASSGRYVCQFPTSSPAGNYSWATYLQAGGSPASTDACVGTGGGYWDGSTFGNSGAVASLPSPAPAGYGPIGTGSVAVNHDYPTSGNLSYKTAGGAGIGGALVRAYLASEWNSAPNSAAIRGQTLTLDDGTWANYMDLDPGSFVVTYAAPGYQLATKALTVS